MSLLSVGVIGYGVVGRRRIQHILQNKKLKLKYVSDIKFKRNFSNKKIVYFKNYLDLIKNRPNVIFVTLPNYLASKVTKLCLKNKIHVFCEKPPGRNVSDIKSVITQENLDKKIKLKYGFNHRYHGSIRKAKKIIDDKIFGNILNIRGVYGKSKIVTFGKNEWRSSREKAGGGILLDQGIHMLDLMRYFAGDFTSVHAFISNSFWNFDVEDNAYVMMKSDSGIVAQLMSSATQWQHTFNLNITLEKGSLVLGGLRTSSKSYGEETLRIISSDAEKLNTKPQVEERSYDEDISWDEEIKCFAGVLLNSDNIENGSIDEALKIMELIETIYKADPEWRAKYYNESR